MVAVYMLPEFAKWVEKEKITNDILLNTASEVINGLHDGDLGAHCYKKRLAIKGKGKRSGARTIVSYRINDFLIYVYAYAKNQKSNLSPKEQKALKLYSKEVLMKLSADSIKRLINERQLIEVVI
ncbi:type II toxin-antitoxin system RelE/ParE family toxin [Fangia hongkongensis]|uniref:type II toxin-antitoxin system RelE/ParE family toxin n=2 Tax=Fangia hongkongensis TaxID=270495 RepID=UPI00037A1AAE|nr:type II toxin-antitoxin system RelE/ParE family toxin [Fangia hongkongensis]